MPLFSVKSLFIVIAVLQFCFPLNAAEVKRATDESCSIQLRGVIEEGDRARIENSIKVNYPTENEFEVLCLDSPGGDFNEAIEISDLVSKKYIRTFVPENSSCLSACAIVFMFGKREGEESASFIDRKIHYTATLGFHRPAINILDRVSEFRKEEVEYVFDYAFEKVFHFFDLTQKMGATFGAVFPPSLFTEMIEAKGNDLFYIDNVQKALWWDIPVVGWTPPRFVDANAFSVACEVANHISRTEARGYSPIDYSAPTYPFRTRFVGGEMIFSTEFGYLGEGSWGCSLYLERNNGKVRICFELLFESNGECYSSELLLLPPSTPLRNLPHVSVEVEARGEAYYREYVSQSPRIQETCWLDAGIYYVANVSNYVNVRSEQGFDSPVIYEAPRNSELIVSNSADFRLWGDRDLKEKCFYICAKERALRYLSPIGDRNSIAYCYEENVFWYQVEARGGVTGWVSGKFLQPQ